MSAVMSSLSVDVSESLEASSVDELDAAIGRLVRQMNCECYRLLVLLREFDDRFAWKKWSCKSCAEWFSWRAGIGLSAAREKVRTAHQLRTFPLIEAAFAAGRLSYSKARTMTRAAHLCDEGWLVAYAVNATVQQVEERCRQIRNVAPEAVHDARRAWASRSLKAWRDERRGLMRITVEVPLEEGELVLRSLECAVAAGDVSTDVDPAAGAESKSAAWAAQQADALVVVAQSYVNGGDDSDGAATSDRYLVTLHADMKSLTRGTGRADLPLETMKRLLCDCSVVTVVEDDEGNPLCVGRKQRTLSTPLRRALFARDRGCTFPGCHRKRHVDGHHLKHWIHGGETTAENLTLLCTHHHRMLHEGGFSIVKERDGALRFLTADGRTIPRCGYRLDDFVDDDIGGDAEEAPSREGFSAADLQPHALEVREPAIVYRIPTAAAASST